MQNNDPFVDVDVGNIIDEYLEEKSRPKTIGAYYPSEIGMCMRRSYYSYFIFIDDGNQRTQDICPWK